MKRLLVLSFIFLAACSSPAVAPTATPAAQDRSTDAPSATQTLEPSATSTKTPITIITRTPTITYTPTFTPSATPTRFPVPPLTKYEFFPSQILVRMSDSPGDGRHFGISPPSLIIYGNGELLISEDPPVRRNLPRRDLCKLLNSIDQTGFFELDQSTLGRNFDGPPLTDIEVNSAENHYLYYPLLSAILYENNFYYEWFRTIYIPASLRETFLLLDNYNPGGMKYYEPNIQIAWVQNSDGNPGSVSWPVSSIRLADLLPDASDERAEKAFIIDGQDLPPGIVPIESGYYLEGDRYYEIFIRPAWPYETITEYGRLVDLGPPASELTEPIECVVSDGLLPIPELP